MLRREGRRGKGQNWEEQNAPGVEPPGSGQAPGSPSGAQPRSPAQAPRRLPDSDAPATRNAGSPGTEHTRGASGTIRHACNPS